MVGHKHSAASLLDAALAVVHDEGLHRLSFGRVARRAGTSDRVVVYYFPTRDTLVGAVVSEIGRRLLAGLEPVLKGPPAADHRALAARAWLVVREPGSAALLTTYVEAMGLAAGGTAPYTALAPAVVDSWVEQLEAHVAGDPERRRSEALAALALLDGLLLLRLAAGPAQADTAARALGLV